GFIISPMFAWLFQGAFLSFIVGETVEYKSKVYMTLEDEGINGTELFGMIAENADSLRISQIINITREEGAQLILNRTLTVWIVIPGNYTELLTTTTRCWVEFYVNTGNFRANSVAYGIRNYIYQQVTRVTYPQRVFFIWETIAPESTYGHQLAIFLIMLTSVLAPAPYVSQSFAGEREKHTLEALLVVPMSRIKILLSKLVAGLILTSIYTFFTVIGVFVYNGSIIARDAGLPDVPIDYTAFYTVDLNSLPLIVFCQFLVLLCSIGIGIVISCLAKDQATAESVNNLILLVPTMVIGILGFTGSISNFGGLFGMFVMAIPFTHAVLILEGALTGAASLTSLIGNISYLLGFTIVFLIIGARLFEREAIIA
ncbi:MAG: ABC transporter permease, partial [Candidatus Thorarchaeota archaeon]